MVYQVYHTVVHSKAFLVCFTVKSILSKRERFGFIWFLKNRKEAKYNKIQSGFEFEWRVLNGQSSSLPFLYFSNSSTLWNWTLSSVSSQSRQRQVMAGDWTIKSNQQWSSTVQDLNRILLGHLFLRHNHYFFMFSEGSNVVSRFVKIELFNTLPT